MNFRTFPILGRKSAVPLDDISLVQMMGKMGATHDTGGQHVSYSRQRNACSKNFGTDEWSNSDATSSLVRFSFELDDGTNRDNLIFSAGDVFAYDGNKDPVDITGAGSTGSAVNFCGFRYGSYIVFTDDGLAGAPYKWKNGDASISALITAGGATQYRFKYMDEWRLHIIGAYSNQTSGEIDIRWTDALPAWATLSFPSANQLYKPGSDSITGLSKLGANILLLYGTESISKIDYYPGATPVFGISPIVHGCGSTSNNGIVNAEGANWFFSKNYGFVRYSGAQRISNQDIISRDIEDKIADISPNRYERITGAYLPMTNQIVWGVPRTSTTLDWLYYYDIRTGAWTISPFNANVWHIDAWTQSDGEYQKLMVCGDEGQMFSVIGDQEDFQTTSTYTDYDSFRVEPAMYFGHLKRKKTLKTLWFGIVDGGDYSLDVFHRAGDTVKEISGATWDYVGSLNLDDPADPVIYIPDNIDYVIYNTLAGGTFAIGDTITSAVGSRTATILADYRMGAAAGILYLENLSGALQDGEEIDTGGGVTADCNGASVNVKIKQTARYHQIKWGTDAPGEYYSINRIDYSYSLVSRY